GEVTRLVCRSSAKSLAVHGVRRPHDLVARVFHGAHDIWQHSTNTVMPHARDHGQPSWNPVRVELLSVSNSLIRCNSRTDLQTNRVSDERGEVNVEVSQPTGALTNPDLVR